MIVVSGGAPRGRAAVREFGDSSRADAYDEALTSRAHERWWRTTHPERQRARVCAVAAAVGAAGVVDPAGLAPFGPAKWAAVTAAMLTAAFVVLRSPIRAARTPSIAWVAFLVVATLTAALGADPLYAWIGTPERHFGWLTWALCGIGFLVGQQLRNAEFRALVVALAALGAVAGVWAAAELGGWNALALAGAGRPIGVMGSSAFLGALASLTTPTSMAAMLDRSWRRAHRVAFAAAAASSGMALVASGARAAWTGAAAASVVVVACRRRSLRRPTTATLVAALVVAAAFVVPVAIASGVAVRVPDAFSEREGGAHGRVDEWRTAARVIAAHPVTGVGPEGYRIAFAAAVDADYERRHGRDPLPDRAHSLVLDVAATTGLPGVALFLLVLASLTPFVARALRGAAPMAVGVAAAVLAYAIQSLFLFQLAELDPVVWLAVGALVGSSARDHELAKFSTAARVRPTLALALAGAALVGALDVVADRAARRTLTEVAAGRSPADPAFAARLRPDAVRYRLVAVRGYEASTRPGAFAEALDHLDAATRLSPGDPVVQRERARVLLDRARTTTASDDIARAVMTLRTIARSDPNNAEVQLRLGLALALADDLVAAERAWRKAERLAPRSSSAATNLAIAYARQGRTDDARRAAERAVDRSRGEDGT